MKVIDKINKIKYIPAEIKISQQINDIIFDIQRQSKGEFTKGAKFEEVANGLRKKKLLYSDQFVENLIKKLREDRVLYEIDGYWYSVML